jgi:hypothetical protein
MPPGARCEVFGGVFVATPIERHRIVCGWYTSEIVLPADEASPCALYGPLSEIAMPSIATIFPSFLKPTLMREVSAGRARPM